MFYPFLIKDVDVGVVTKVEPARLHKPLYVYTMLSCLKRTEIPRKAGTRP